MQAAPAAPAWWTFPAILCACFCASCCVFACMCAVATRSARDAHPTTPEPAYLTQPPGGVELDDTFAEAYVGRPYADYLDGLFERDGPTAADSAMPLMVLRQGTSQTTEIPPRTELVLVDAQGRFLGGGATFDEPERAVHAGVVAQWSDFPMQYTPTRPGVEYEFFEPRKKKTAV